MNREGPRTFRFQSLIDEGLMAIGDGYRAKLEELGGDGPIFLRAGHVEDTHIDFKGTERFRKDLESKVQSKMSKAGDTVVTTKGNSTGRTAYVAPDMPPFVYSPHLSYWRSLDPDLLAPRFLRYWALGEEFRSQLDGMKLSTDMAPYLSLTDQRRLSITLPDPQEQHLIAGVLGAMDDKIGLNRRMNQTLEAMVQALFRSWFVDFDPVIAKAAGGAPYGLDETAFALFPDCFVESTIGEIPKGWTTRPVGETVESLFDGPHATPPESQEGAIFLGIGNISENQIDLTEIRRINESDWPRWTRRVTPRANDIVFSYEATLGNFALIPGWLRCCLGRRLALIRPRSGNSDTHFLFHYFTGKAFQEYLSARIVSGATVDRISLNDFPSYPVLTPPQPLLQVFEKQAERTWKLIHSNIRQNLILAETRGALLPRLLSGEIRVGHAEKVIEAAL